MPEEPEPEEVPEVRRYKINGMIYGSDEIYLVGKDNGTWDLYRVSDNVLLDNLVMRFPDVEVH